MKKYILIIGLLLFVVGGVLLGISLSNGALYEASQKTIIKDKEITESFSNIKIDVSTSDVVFEKSTNNKCKIIVEEREKYYFEIEIIDDTLLIRSIDDYKFYENLVPMLGNTKVTIYLPLDAYNKFDIKVSTGDIESKIDLTLNEFRMVGSTGDCTIENMSVNGKINIDLSTGDISLLNTTCTELSVDVSTGKTYLKQVNANEISIVHTTGKAYLETVRGESVNISGDTGKVFLTDAVFTGHLFINTTTGDVTFKDSDADTIEIIGETSDVTGNLLTGKTFITKTSTGKNKPQPGVTGNECKITTTTGDIIITVGK